MKFFEGEWFLNSEHGLPYFQDILGSKNLDLNILESILREQILDVQGIKEILETSIDYNETERQVDYVFRATTINNTVLTDNLITLV